MRWLVTLVVVVAAATAAQASRFEEADYFAKTVPTYSIPTPTGGSIGEVSVIGEVQIYRIRKGDTLMDLARYYSLGYNEIVDANPGIDPWVPPVGATVLLPTEWVLPCCSYRGVVVNIPEMRLFYMRPAENGETLIDTYPVGLGRDDWRTPEGKFVIRGKTVNPQWNIPPSIREEHIRDRGDYRTFIPGGAPDNPLGKHRLELSLPMYRIHGTNIPWGVGMQVSHGCVRLYPEDIERLFPRVPIGTPGEFAYDTIKFGMRNGALYGEAHSDIYGYKPAAYRDAEAKLEALGLTGRIDREELVAGLTDSRGLPFRITPGDDGPQLVMFDPVPDDD